jgi:Fur family peroxide stress response transcriptional regulator
MNTYLKSIIEDIENAGLRPSLVRIKVLSYIRSKRNHPSAEMIYADLIDEIPTLSLTSVYNTLLRLESSNLVRLVSVSNTERRYDATMSDHGHFQCRRCGKIIDLDVEFNTLKSQIPEDYIVFSRDLFIYGICADCRKIVAVPSDEKHSR